VNIKQDKLICYCIDDQYYTCEIDELGPVYPGQTYTLNLIVRNTRKLESVLKVSINDGHNRACKTRNINDHFQLFKNACTKIDYNIHYDKNGKTCELYFQGTSITSSLESTELKSNWQFLDAYRINLLPCPAGFVFDEVTLMCQCDPVLTVFSSCNIDDQTVVRPANSWVVGRNHSQIYHVYQLSLQCPFDYCLPQSSHLNLFDPDSQCQFRRTGLLCGRCKAGLSTVFGTSQCKQCTYIYLFLLLPFTLAGIAVILYFCLFQTSLLLMEKYMDLFSMLTLLASMAQCFSPTTQQPNMYTH